MKIAIYSVAMYVKLFVKMRNVTESVSLRFDTMMQGRGFLSDGEMHVLWL